MWFATSTTYNGMIVRYGSSHDCHRRWGMVLCLRGHHRDPAPVLRQAMADGPPQFHHEGCSMRLNNVVFAGKVQEVTDLKQLGSSQVCNVRVYQAYPKKLDDQGNAEEWHSDWVTIVCWGKSAEIAQTLEKKQEIVVEGRLRYETWETGAGEKRSELRITASFLHKVGPAATTRSAPLPVAQTSSADEPPF